MINVDQGHVVASRNWKPALPQPYCGCNDRAIPAAFECWALESMIGTENVIVRYHFMPKRFAIACNTTRQIELDALCHEPIFKTAIGGKRLDMQLISAKLDHLMSI